MIFKCVNCPCHHINGEYSTIVCNILHENLCESFDDDFFDKFENGYVHEKCPLNENLTIEDLFKMFEVNGKRNTI